MKRRIRVGKHSFYILLWGAFALSCVVAAVYARSLGSVITAQGVTSHFSPDRSSGIKGILSAMSSSFRDDAFEILYLFVAGFMIWGKPISFGIVAYRGAVFGYYFTALANTYVENSSLFSLTEYFLFLSVNLAVNFITVRFSFEALNFNSEIKSLYPQKWRILKSPVFFRYLADTVVVCGIIAVCKSIYTLLIMLL